MLILLDNGSKRPEATRNLRRLANALSRRLGERARRVHLKDGPCVLGEPQVALGEGRVEWLPGLDSNQD